MLIPKRKLGMVGTKRCRRCLEWFYPTSPKNVFCPYCAGLPKKKGRPVNVPYCRVVGCGKEREPSVSARGLCREHYQLLVRNPANLKKRRKIAAEKWKKEGMIMCKFFEECEVFFQPKARNQFGIQKYCPTCNARQHSKFAHKKAGSVSPG